MVSLLWAPLQLRLPHPFAPFAKGWESRTRTSGHPPFADSAQEREAPRSFVSACKDLEEIWDYIALDNLDAADRVRAR